MARIKHGTWVNATCNGGHSGVFANAWTGMPANPDQYQYNDGTTIPAQYSKLNGTEQAVIVGSGGNEAYFGEVMQYCLGHSDDYNANRCTETYGANGAGLLAKTQNSQTAIAGVLDYVHTRSPNAKVFLIGTPRIAPPDGAGCWPNPILTLADAPVWSVWEDSLRQSMMSVVASRSSYATFVDMQAISGTTHSMCAPSTMRWMNSWTVENIQYPGLALHNTPWGADATADALISAFKSAGLNTGTPDAPTLTRTSPTASPTNSTSQTFTYAGAAGSTFKCRLDNAAYTTCPSSPVTLNGLAGGAHSYSVTQTDAAGNVSPAALVNWTIDTTAPLAPTVSRTSPTTSPTASPTQTLTYTGAESGGTFQCKLDNAAYAACPPSPVSLGGLTTGSHTYYVRQIDAASNTGAAGSVTWTVDVTPPGAPTVTRTSPSANPTNLTTQVLTYAGAEGGGTYQCKLDAESFAACTGSPVTLTGLSAGTHTFTVTQTDAVGNVGSASTVTWVIDTTAPLAPTVARTVPTATPTNSATQTLTYAGAEAGGTYRCKLDTAAYAACGSSPVTVAGLGSGSHTYSVTQTDAAGNTSPPGTVGWTVDVTPPPPPSVSGPSGLTALNTATISYSNSEAGVTFQCKLDSASYADCPPSPVSLSGLANGAHSYSVTATDATGNTSTAGVASWTVDPSGFTTSITSGPNNPSTVSSASFAFTATITAGTTYECKLDGGSFSSCTSAKSYSGLADGTHTFTVHAINGGQFTPDATRTWVIDATPPGATTLTRTSPTADPTNSNSQTFSLAAAEPGGVLSCKLDSGFYATCPTSPITVAGLSDGSHTFSAIQTDAAGNTGPAASVTWTVDTTAPAAPSIARTNPTITPTSSTSQTISYGGLEPGATTQCKLDTGSYGSCQATPFTLGGLAEGSHTVQITQTDTAGNTSAPGSVSWIVDSIAPGAPTLSRTSPAVTPTNSKAQEFAYSGTESGGSYQCKLDSAPWASCAAGGTTISNLSDGPHIFSVTQTDATGNTGSTASVVWTVDTIAPLKPGLGFNRPSVTNVNSATIGIEPAESGGTMQCAMDFGAWSTCSSNTIELTGLADGNHNYAIRQIDDAGNIGAGAQASWLIDTVAPAAPTVTRTSPATSPTYDTTASLSVAGNEVTGALKCKLDGASYATCPSNPISLSGLSIGSHTFSATQTDAAGNVSIAGTATWTVELDTTPPPAPLITRTAPTANPTTSTSQTISFAALEEGGTLQCRLDAGNYTSCPSSPATLNGLANGAHTIYITQTDSAGNVSTPGTVSWTVDNIAPGAPTLARTAPTANPTNSTSQTLTFSGAEGGGTLLCKLDSDPYAACPSSPLTFSGLANGSHTFSVTQTDVAGNTSNAATATWTVDNIAPGAPTVTRTVPTANPTNSTSQTLSYSGEAGGTFQCKLDTGSFVSCPSSPLTLNGFSNGSHTLTVTQTDAAGNVSPASTATWTVDNVPPSAPTVTRTAPTANPTIQTSQTLAYSGESGGSFQCKLDDGAYAACSSSPVSLNGLANGAHSYSVIQTDAAGNVSTPGVVTWTIGEGPAQPTVTRTAPTASLTNSSSQTFSYEGTAGNTFKCKLDDGAYAVCPASPATLSALGDGTHTISVTQTDNEGNTSPAGSATWTVDTTAPLAPTVTRTDPTESPTTSTSQTLTYAGEAGGEFECKLDSEPFATCASSPLVLVDLGPGAHVFSVRQIDAAGNASSAGSASWTIPGAIIPVDPVDPTPPTGKTPEALTAKLSAISPRTIEPGRSGPTFSLKKKGSVAAFRVTLSRATTVSLRLERVVAGRRKSSTAWTKLTLKSGTTKIYFSGRAGGSALKSGSYRVSLTYEGAMASVVSATFRIKR